MRQPPSLVASALRIFDLSLGQMLWSRRSVFLAILVGRSRRIVMRHQNHFVADGVRALPECRGRAIGGGALFGLMIWLLYIRFIVPVLGVFYGTSLIADEIDDKTITYLFTRPIPRASVLLGKYAAYLACTALIVLPSVVLVYFLIVPIRGGSIGAAFPSLAADLGMLAVGLASYGALFASRRCPAQATARHRAGLCVWLGTGSSAVSGLSQAPDRGLLPAGTGPARDAGRLSHEPAPADRDRGSVPGDEPAVARHSHDGGALARRDAP